MSDQARRVKSKQRAFTEDDLLILATIATLSTEGLNYENIRSRLEDGYRVEHPGAANFGVDTRMVPAAAVEQIIDATEIKTELAQVKAERDKLLEMIEREQSEKRDLQSKIDLLQNEIRQLSERLGRAEGRLEERDKKRRWF